MTDRSDDATMVRRAEALRARAEAALGDQPTGRAEVSAEDPAKLLHELNVHQIELEMQNAELRASQLELAEMRDRYFELYHLAPIGYLTLERSGKVQESNLQAAVLLGVERARLAGRPLAAFMAESDADVLHRHLQDVFATRVRHSCDVVLEVASGHRVPVHIDTVARAEQAGDPTECRMTLVDRSEIESVRDSLRTSEAQNRTLIDTAVDAIVVSDASGRIEMVNAAAERMFGHTDQELRGRSVRALMPARYRHAHDGHIERFLTTGQGGIIGRPAREFSGLRRDGTEFPLELSIGAWSDRGERKFTAVLRDVSALRRQGEEVRASEARLRQIADHVTDVFFIAERDTRRVSYASPAFETLWGRRVAEVFTDDWRDWLYPADRDRVVGAWLSHLDGGSFDEEFRIVRPDGQVRWARGRAFPVEEADGSVQRDIAVIQDITRERALGEELRQAQKMEALGALASGLAHDFGNVLQAILGCLNRALAKGPPNDAAAPYLESAAQAVRRGGDLTKHLMAFARKREVMPRPFRLDAMVQRTVPLLQRLVTSRIAVESSTKAKGAYVLADPVQVEQILLNLAANARDAMPTGGTLVLRTAVMTNDELRPNRTGPMLSGPYVVLEVEDSGVGMDDQTRARIFEPFFTTKDVGQGTGLGLSTVFSVTQQLGGHLEVQSEPGKGAKFVFHFPQVERAPGPSFRPPAPPQLAGTALLVEADPLVRATLRYDLEALGLVVLEARTEVEARELCAAHDGPVDLLVADVVLPGRTGPSLANRLHVHHPAMRVLELTANPEFLAEGAVAGDGRAVLEKPFGREQLAAALTALMTSEPPHLAARRRTSAEADVGKTILVVEDDPITGPLLAQVLQDRGYRVLLADRPSQALSAAAEQERPIALLLTDFALPEMSGGELADELRKLQPDLRVVFMSALEEPVEGKPVSVQKPIDVEALLDVIGSALTDEPHASD